MTTVNTNNQVSQDLLNSVNTRSSTSTTDETQDRFMTLLVTQMKNQDPLNPMDNAQVTSQMAQLNTVTGINKLNETMSSLIGSVQLGQAYQATSMIGRNVLVEGKTLTHTETGGYFGVNVPNGADSLSVAIKNGSGATVRTLTFGKQDVGVNALSWDGKLDDGTTAPSGDYSYEITAKTGDNTVTSTALSLAQVQSVTTSTSGAKLNLSNNTTVSASDISEIF
ncbi:flagellar hook assembly protein FlgD [Methylophilus sp. 5]|uniref:flagellar hook assembly protein FlgD n=1 Tax=Methylophilus sp. 5 TaxID=1112274 RepID=UPI00048F5D33|nr:flagellar hook assembly protein FlgD [Methylophilus sp. 5]